MTFKSSKICLLNLSRRSVNCTPREQNVRGGKIMKSKECLYHDDKEMEDATMNKEAWIFCILKPRVEEIQKEQRVEEMGVALSQRTQMDLLHAMTELICREMQKNGHYETHFHQILDLLLRKQKDLDVAKLCRNVVVKKAEGFGCSKIVQKCGWCKPVAGGVKVNWAVSRDGESCAYFIRNSRGMFCAAEVYSREGWGEQRELVEDMLRDCLEWCKIKGEGCTLRDLVKERLHDCEEWCSKKMICKVWVESHSWSGIEMNSTNQGVMMRRSQCSEKGLGSWGFWAAASCVWEGSEVE
nr:uncharacterized protein LOC109147873 [Ipomoea batatas]